MLSQYLAASMPAVVVLVKPVNVDASHQVPFAPVTSTQAFGVELTERGGAFETLGWATATNPYQDRLIDDATLLDDVRALVARRTEMTINAARREDWRVLLSVLSTPDRVQHMFWRDRDASHPAHDAAGAARRGDGAGGAAGARPHPAPRLRAGCEAAHMGDGCVPRSGPGGSLP